MSLCLKKTTQINGYLVECAATVLKKYKQVDVFIAYKKLNKNVIFSYPLC